MRRRVLTTAVFAALLFTGPAAHAQSLGRGGGLWPSWFILQTIPSLTFYSSHPGLEWEVTPLLYSFGMNAQVSPWHAFIVVPPARFTGSLELSVAGQVYPSRVGGSYVGYSGTLMGYLPILQRGENLTLNVGVSAYRVDGLFRVFKVVGWSSAFGMVHLNVKHADRPSTWVTSLEVRIF